MNRTLTVLVLASLLLPACGGSDSGPGSANTPAPAVGAPAPTPAATPTAGDPSPAAPPAAAPPPAAPSPDEGDSCSVSMRMVNGHVEYDEHCGATSRQCTLDAGDSAWSCLCALASGSLASCQAAAPPGAVTTPADCCPVR